MRFKKIFALMSLSCLLLPGTVLAASGSAAIHPVIPAKAIHVYVDGREVVSDTEPVLVNDHTMLPIRSIAEALGAQVTWENDGAVDIQRDSMNIMLGIGEKTAIVGGQTIELNTPPILYNGRTMVPVRFIAEHLDCNITWNPSDLSVHIKPSASRSISDVKKAVLSSPAADQTGMKDLDSILSAIHGHLTKQETTFVLRVPSSYFGKGTDLLNKALEQDDYLSFIVSRMEASEKEVGSVDTISFKVQYRENADQTRYVKRQVKMILAKILTPGMNDFQKEKAIHDYIVTHLAYDQSFQEESYTAYGALVNGKAVCQGYALLMYRMLTNAGLKARIYEGSADNGFSTELHAWNGVMLSGKWYDVDVTWDDPVGSAPNAVSYRYYNLSDRELRKDHLWTKSYPAADTSFVQTLQSQILSDPGRAVFYQSLLNLIRPLRQKA